MPTDAGIPLVLTADRVLMADYQTLLDGMLAASQTTAAVPEFVMRAFVAPEVPAEGVRALRAPIGLRRIEAALLAGGIPRDDVAIVPPRLLDQAVGPRTRAVFISSGDPLGFGMNDSTMVGLSGGEMYNPLWYRAVAGKLAALRDRGLSFRIVAGGPGAWQLVRQPEEATALGIDAIHLGYLDGEAAVALGRRALSGEPLDPVTGPPARPESEPAPLAGAAIMGVVEVSRGCGLGCPFCTMAEVPMVHLRPERVVADVETNVRQGAACASLMSEDFLRYGARGTELAPEAVLGLAGAVRAVPGLRLIQLDHVSVSSAARFPPEALAELYRTLTRGVRHEYLWVNVGVETLDGGLLREYGCRGKLHPFGADEWPEACENAVRNLIAAGFTPMVSLLTGLPGEEERQIRRTIEFVTRLKRERVTVFPMFLEPVREGGHRIGPADMTAAHWELFRTCYEINFRMLPAMFRDNQRGAGVSWLKRAMVQVGGRARKFPFMRRLKRLAKKGPVMIPDRDRIARTYAAAQAFLAAERGSAPHWRGELSSSALSTATAISALCMGARSEQAARIALGAEWLEAHQNVDGGWGDTLRSRSNLSTACLAYGALSLAGRANAPAAGRAKTYIEAAGGFGTVAGRYGEDRTFSAPILTNLALAGLVPWTECPRLPFALAALPRTAFRMAGLRVVSYALPALVAVGLAQFEHARHGRVTRVMGRLAARRALALFRP